MPVPDQRLSRDDRGERRDRRSGADGSEPLEWILPEKAHTCLERRSTEHIESGEAAPVESFGECRPASRLDHDLDRRRILCPDGEVDATSTR